MAQTPTAAFVLSLIGGVFILLGGAYMATAGARIFTLDPNLGLGIGALGVAVGAFVLVGTVMLYVRPERHRNWGIIILIFSVLSVFPAIGGGLIGMILGIIGGALAISWKPAPSIPAFGVYSPPTGYIPPPDRVTSAPPGPLLEASATPTAPVCKSCGAAIVADPIFCTNCGVKV